MGKLILIEGTDCSGKETQSRLLVEKLNERGKKAVYFTFPYYESPTGKIVGGPYLGKEEICKSFFEEGAPKVDPIVSSLYYAADRRYNFIKTISGELDKNDIIILDRYTTSNMGHQASKAISDEEFDKIVNFIERLEYDLCKLPVPDVVVFLHMPTLASQELRKGRKYSDDNEKDISHLMKAERSYVKLANMKGWTYINCLKTNKFRNISDIKSIDEIHDEVVRALNRALEANNEEIETSNYLKAA